MCKMMNESSKFRKHLLHAKTEETKNILNCSVVVEKKIGF